MDHGQVVGMLFHGDFFQALRQHGDHARVGEIMRSEFNTVEAGSPLEEALAQVQADRGWSMPVLEEGRFVGLLTPENVGEFFMIRSALANRARRPGGVPPVIRVPPVMVPSAPRHSG